MYWRINDKWEVVEFYRQLPKVIWNTQLGKNITNEELKAFNILPVVWISLPLKEWQSYWEKTYKVLEDRIEEDRTIIDQPLDEYKVKKIKTLSELCRSDIIAEYDEDTQRNLTARWIELIDKKLDWWLTTEEQEELNWVKEVKKFIDFRLAEYHSQKEHIVWLTTYEEIKDYVKNLLPKTII